MFSTLTQRSSYVFDTKLSDDPIFSTLTKWSSYVFDTTSTQRMRFRHYPATSKLQNSFLVGVPHHVFQKRSCRKPLVAMSGIFFKAPITDWLEDGLLTLKSFFWQLALSLVQCVL